MANNVANVGKVTSAINGVAIAGRNIVAGMPLRANWVAGRTDSSEQALRAPVSASAAAEASLSELDPASNETPARVTRGPITDVVELDGLLMTANYAADTVSLLAPKTLHPVIEVADIYEPFAIAVAGRRAFISSVEPAYDTVTVLERGAVIARIPVADTVRDIAVSADGRAVYAAVAAEEGAALAVVDVDTQAVSTLDLAAGAESVPVAVATGPGGIVYVAVVDDASGLLLAVRGKRVLGAVPVPSMIRDIAVSGSTVFVASDDDEFGGLVDVIDASDAAQMQITRTLELGATVAQLSMSADGQRAYVVNGDRVTMLCASSRQIVDHIEIASPAAALESADRTRLLVTDNNGGITAFALDGAADWVPPVLDGEVIDEQMRELATAGV